MSSTREIETAELLECVAMIGDVLIQKQAGDDLNAISGVIKKDFTDSAFARGFMLGVNSVLKCGGVPMFLSGDGVRELQIRLLTIAAEFKVAEFLESKGLAV